MMECSDSAGSSFDINDDDDDDDEELSQNSLACLLPIQRGGEILDA
jgi:hypothetical protein